MRNVFDQYDQPENKLTHALYSTLVHDRRLILPFLKWLGATDCPAEKDIRIVQQQVPGVAVSEDDGDGTGLPDLCFYSDSGWAVVCEMKVQAQLTASQLRRHAATVRRCGFESPQLFAFTVDAPRSGLPKGTTLIQWRRVYAWFDQRRSDSTWTSVFTEYMEIFEAKSLARGYDIRGTLTMFNGLRFDDDNPYTYREGKRLIRLLGAELRSRAELHQIGVDPKGTGRTAITSGDTGDVWDYLPLRGAGEGEFTRYPHLSIFISSDMASASVTVPNGVGGGFKSRLKITGLEGFVRLLQMIEKNLRPVVMRSEKSKPVMYVTQRHFRSQRSIPTVDGRLNADLRTCTDSSSGQVKYQPEWAEALYSLLVNKKSNLQFGIQMQFDYGCKRIRSAAAVDLFVDSWVAMKPLLEFVLDE